jgi:hypothetical protein
MVGASTRPSARSGSPTGITARERRGRDSNPRRTETKGPRQFSRPPGTALNPAYGAEPTPRGTPGGKTRDRSAGPQSCSTELGASACCSVSTPQRRELEFGLLLLRRRHGGRRPPSTVGEERATRGRCGASRHRGWEWRGLRRFLAQTMMTFFPRPCPSSASLRAFGASCSGKVLLMTGVILPASMRSLRKRRSSRRSTAVRERSC